MSQHGEACFFVILLKQPARRAKPNSAGFQKLAVEYAGFQGTESVGTAVNGKELNLRGWCIPEKACICIMMR